MNAKKRPGVLEVMAFGCEAIGEIDPQGLALTYWFDTPPAGEPGPVRIRFTGRHASVKGRPGAGETFSAVETVDVIPGTGPIAVTARVEGIRSGEWLVTATPLGNKAQQHRRSGRSRVPDLAGHALESNSGRTTYAPVISVLAPGARLGAWPMFVGLGLLVGLAVQGVVADHLGLRVWPTFVISILASVAGLVGSKLYYAIGHYLQGERRLRRLLSGSCIQGFVLGAVAALAVGVRVGHLPLGSELDVTAPPLMFGMSLGRYGCFFGGCCAGRPTSSRWGLWSSDRRVGMRRVPVQLFESSVALAIGVAALLALWFSKPAPAGTVFVGVIAAYTLGRQLLFPLRDCPRHIAHARRIMLVFSVVALAADIAVAMLDR